MVVSELELWGRIECTVNRVGDTFFDQVERTGHATRIDDLDRLVGLGVRALRYPILWERSSRSVTDEYDLSWADPRMQRLRDLGVRVIVGLVHHGSGPMGTSLLDERFASGLARFAEAVAKRYPWIEDYTPVNEPLTTARFSALYGHWYPHTRDTAAFLRALMIQTRATMQAMRSIRTVVPGARLIQTEDFGSSFATSKLKYQANFENHRKWLSLDLLFGRVTRRHPLYRYLVANGVATSELSQLAEQPCPVDLIGVNYYVTSDRFLDERVSRYPRHVVGSNGRDQYADVEAVRVRRKGIVGYRDVLTSAWTRYHTPLAITEAHLGCAPEEQVRWLAEAWNGAQQARDAGVDTRAVTLWSAFGAYDWDSLATRAHGHYEPGAFDIRGPFPRPTALANVAQELACSGQSNHPILGSPGWWHSPRRLLRPPSPAALRKHSANSPSLRPVLITGSGGILTRAFLRVCEERGLTVKCLTQSELDMGDSKCIDAALDTLRPWLVVNASGITPCDEATELGEHVFRDTEAGALHVAQSCQRRHTRLVTFSSALVFNGEKATPYLESDLPSPSCALGLSHATAERLVLEAHPEALVVRAGILFDVAPHAGHLWEALRKLALGEMVFASRDTLLSLVFAPELAHSCLDMALANLGEIVHLAPRGVCNAFDFIQTFARVVGIDSRTLSAANPEQCRLWRHPRRLAMLASERAATLSTLDDCLARVSQMPRCDPFDVNADRAA